MMHAVSSEMAIDPGTSCQLFCQLSVYLHFCVFLLAFFFFFFVQFSHQQGFWSFQLCISGEWSQDVHLQIQLTSIVRAAWSRDVINVSGNHLWKKGALKHQHPQKKIFCGCWCNFFQRPLVKVKEAAEIEIIEHYFWAMHVQMFKSENDGYKILPLVWGP